MAHLTLRVPAVLSAFIAPKGSVALDGVSLTVNEVANNEFSVLIIPHTLEVTTFGALQAGSRLNLEVDRINARVTGRGSWKRPDRAADASETTQSGVAC